MSAIRPSMIALVSNTILLFDFPPLDEEFWSWGNRDSKSSSLFTAIAPPIIANRRVSMIGSHTPGQSVNLDKGTEISIATTSPEVRPIVDANIFEEGTLWLDDIIIFAANLVI